MHSNQTVSLRPGGGGKGRLLTTVQGSNILLHSRPTFDGKATEIKSTKHYVERIKYTREELFKLKEVLLPVSKEINDAASEIKAELAIPHEQEWARSQPHFIQIQQPLAPAARFDNRDWKNRVPVIEDKGKDQEFKELGKSSASVWRDKDQEHNGQFKEPAKHSGSDWRDKDQEHNGQFKEPVKSSGSDWRDKDQKRNGQFKEAVKSLGSEWRDKDQERYGQFKEPLKSLGSDWRDKVQERDGRVSEVLRQQDLGVDATKTVAVLCASNPWTVQSQRRALTDKERVLRTVKGILNKLTPEKFDILLEQLLKSGIDSADILKGVISLVFDKAVLEPTFCAMYAEMCVCLSKSLQEFPSDEVDGKPITFRRILLNSCQEEFEGADNMRSEIRQLTKPEQEVERLEKEKLVKLRTLGNIRLIGELFKQRMIPEKIIHYCIQMLLGPDTENPPAEENIEALCQLFTTVGKQLEESTKPTNTIEPYFSQLKTYSTSPRFASRVRFLMQNTIDLRANKWVPRREVVKAKTINEIHAEAEKTLGLRPGMASLRSGREAVSMMGMPGMRRGSGYTMPVGMMPGMPDMMLGMPSMMPGMPGMMPGMPGMMPGMPGMPSMPGLLPMAGRLPATPIAPSFIPGIESDGWEYSANRRNRFIKEGLIPSPNLLPSKTLPTSHTGMRTNSANMKLLAQGRTSVGKSSALLGDYERPGMVERSRSSVGALPMREKIAAPTQHVIERTVSPAPFTPSSLLKNKSDSLLQEYLSVGDLAEALLCVQELKSPPEFYPQFVYLAVSEGLETQDRERELILKLLGELYSKRVISKGDVRAGIMIVVEQLEDLTLDIPLAPKHIGYLVGKVVSMGIADLGLLVDIIQRTKNPGLKKSVYDAAVKAIESDPYTKWDLSQEYKLHECERLIMMNLGS